MNTQELIDALELGVRMRALQRDYFKTRNYKTLRDAQQAERDFDKQAKAALDKAANATTQEELL